MSSEDLLPCPFCGGPATLTGHEAPEFWVHCPKMGCKAGTEAFGDPQRAIDAWNTRAAAPSPDRAESVELPSREEIARALYDAWPHTVISERLAEVTRLPVGEVLTWNVAAAAGADFTGLYRYADAILALLEGRRA